MTTCDMRPWRPETLTDVVCRVKAEYLEMPGLKLTRRQAGRLWDLEDVVCDAVLTTLVNDGFLTLTRTDEFVRQR